MTGTNTIITDNSIAKKTDFETSFIKGKGMDWNNYCYITTILFILHVKSVLIYALD